MGNDRGLDRPAPGGRRGRRRAGLGAAAAPALPRAARLVDRRPDQHGRHRTPARSPRPCSSRSSSDGTPVGPRRHRRYGAAAGGAHLAQQGRERLRREAADRAGHRLLGARREQTHERGRRPRPEDAKARGGFLGWIERVGNKVPHPAMIFLGLIVGRDRAVRGHVVGRRQRHDRRRRARAARGLPDRQRRRARPTPRSPRTPEPAVPDYEVHQETIEAKSLLSGDGIRAHVHHGRPELQRLRRRRGDPGGDDRRRASPRRPA